MTNPFNRGSAPDRARDPWQNPATFEPGHAKLGGRKKGTRNVITPEHKMALLEAVHRVGQVHDLGVALHLHPLAEEAVVEHAERDMRVAGDVLGLHRGLARADDHPAVAVDGARDRRHRDAPVRPGRSHDRVMVGLDEGERVGDVHRVATTPPARA